MAKPYSLASEAAKMPDCDARNRWCQEQTTQDIGVRLQMCGFPPGASKAAVAVRD